MSDHIGDTFQQETKYSRDSIGGVRMDRSAKPETYKEYDGVEVIDLPPPETSEGNGLWDIIAERRSVRTFTRDPLSLQHLSQLLWATQGITERIEGYELRAAPSAGALYPVETYLVVNNVEGIQQGIYHYRVRTAQLELLREGDFSQEIAAAALQQEMCAEAPVVFIWTAVVQRCKWKYGKRAYRYIYLDAGHIGAHLSLACVSLGLGSCQIGALFDDEVNRIIDVDGIEETVVYMSCVGHPAE